jgi:hypothetical protein
MLIGFRQPKQKMNYVKNAQYIPSAPTLANTMLGAVAFVGRTHLYLRKVARITNQVPP